MKRTKQTRGRPWLVYPISLYMNYVKCIVIIIILIYTRPYNIMYTCSTRHIVIIISCARLMFNYLRIYKHTIMYYGYLQHNM